MSENKRLKIRGVWGKAEARSLQAGGTWKHYGWVRCLTEDGRYWLLREPNAKHPYDPRFGSFVGVNGRFSDLIDKINKAGSIDPSHWIYEDQDEGLPDWAQTTANDAYDDANGR